MRIDTGIWPVASAIMPSVETMTKPSMRPKAATPMLVDREIFQQRQDTDNDHDDTHNLLGAAVDRQHVDEVEHKYNDQKRDQDADEHGRKIPCVEIDGLTPLLGNDSIFFRWAQSFSRSRQGAAANNAFSTGLVPGCPGGTETALRRQDRAAFDCDSVYITGAGGSDARAVKPITKPDYDSISDLGGGPPAH